MTSAPPHDQTQTRAVPPRGRLRFGVRLLAVVFFVLGSVQGLSAQSAEQMMAIAEARYNNLVDQVTLMPKPRRNALTLNADAVPDGYAPQLVRVDMRLALLKAVRPEESATRDIVLQAQGHRGHMALSLVAGEIELPQLMAEARVLFPSSVGTDGLGVPLIVEDGATLVLGPGAVLSLNRERGAFLVNLGRLDINGGSIVASGPINPVTPSFAPFVVTAGQGVMMAHDATFKGLGFGHELAFAGLSVVVSSFYQNRVASALTGSVLQDIGSTVFSGGIGVDIADNWFLASRRSALILRATTAARIHGNIFLDGHRGDAIRLILKTKGTDIRANEIYRPKESGIVLMPGSTATRIRDVTVWQPRQHGVRVDGSDCLAISELSVLSARAEGIQLRASHGVTLTDSSVIGSKSAGLLLVGQPGETETHVTRTVFARNRVGIETASPGRLHLNGSNFLEQFPKFLAGDVQFRTPDLLRDLTGKSPIVLAGRNAQNLRHARADAPACPTFAEE